MDHLYTWQQEHVLMAAEAIAEVPGLDRLRQAIADNTWGHQQDRDDLVAAIRSGTASDSEKAGAALWLLGMADAFGAAAVEPEDWLDDPDEQPKITNEGLATHEAGHAVAAAARGEGA